MMMGTTIKDPRIKDIDDYLAIAQEAIAEGDMDEAKAAIRAARTGLEFLDRLDG